DLYKERLFTMYEQRLFTRVVAVAEKQGKPVELIVVPSKNVYHAIAQTARRLDSARIVAGRSWKMSVQAQARQLSRFWKQLPERPRRRIEFSVIGHGRTERIFTF
ncbi:MAG TPA: APC family permease, partial [Blastocatellia bacterium]|nr:APC family permease [Blastocatellia bacterium]